MGRVILPAGWRRRVLWAWLAASGVFLGLSVGIWLVRAEWVMALNAALLLAVLALFALLWDLS